MAGFPSKSDCSSTSSDRGSTAYHAFKQAKRRHRQYLETLEAEMLSEIGV